MPLLLELPRPRPEFPNVLREDEETSPRLSVADDADEVFVRARVLLVVPLLDEREDDEVLFGAVATSSGTGFLILETPEERLEPLEDVRLLDDERVLPVDDEVEDEARAALFSLFALMRSRTEEDEDFGLAVTGSSTTES